MEANVRTPRELFDGKFATRFRPSSVLTCGPRRISGSPCGTISRGLPESSCRSRASEKASALPRHFLGAVVVKQLPSVAGDPARRR